MKFQMFRDFNKHQFTQSAKVKSGAFFFTRLLESPPTPTLQSHHSSRKRFLEVFSRDRKIRPKFYWGGVFYPKPQTDAPPGATHPDGIHVGDTRIFFLHPLTTDIHPAVSFSGNIRALVPALLTVCGGGGTWLCKRERRGGGGLRIGYSNHKLSVHPFFLQFL